MIAPCLVQKLTFRCSPPWPIPRRATCGIPSCHSITSHQMIQKKSESTKTMSGKPFIMSTSSKFFTPSPWSFAIFRTRVRVFHTFQTLAKHWRMEHIVGVFSGNLEVGLDLLPLQIFKKTITYSIHVDCSLFVYFLLNECEKILTFFKTLHSASFIFKPTDLLWSVRTSGIASRLESPQFLDLTKRHAWPAVVFSDTLFGSSGFEFRSDH